MKQAVRCPRCQFILCERTPGGFVAGQFLCKRCRLLMVVEALTHCECIFVVLPAEDAPAHRSASTQQLRDGRLLIPWAEFQQLG